jgi:hypothetical protein
MLAGFAIAHSAAAADATCVSSGRERTIRDVTVDDATIPTGLDIWSGSAARSIPLADITSLTFSGPANRIYRTAPARLNMRDGGTLDVALVLRSGDRTLVLEGAGAEGKIEQMDVLSCDRIDFRTR